MEEQSQVIEDIIFRSTKSINKEKKNARKQFMKHAYNQCRDCKSECTKHESSSIQGKSTSARKIMGNEAKEPKDRRECPLTGPSGIEFAIPAFATPSTIRDLDRNSGSVEAVQPYRSDPSPFEKRQGLIKRSRGKGFQDVPAHVLSV